MKSNSEEIIKAINILFHKYSFFLVVLLYLTLSIFVAVTSRGNSIFGEEGYSHYLIARYAPKHLWLFLDLYGKPLYTILASPFAQLGLFYVVLFNLLATLISSLISYKIVKQINIKNPFVTLICCLLMPYSFISAQSTITEPLSGLLLIAATYLYLNNYLVIGSIFVSFLPFLRPETVFFWLIWFLLLWKKKPKLVFYLFVGIFIFQFAGYFAYKDFLWIVHNYPTITIPFIYTDGKNLSFYFTTFLRFTNPIFSILILIGIISFFHNSNKKLQKYSVRFLLFIWPVFCFLLLSLLTYFKILYPFEYIRYLIPLIPFFGIFVGSGFDLLVFYFNKKIIKKKLSLVLEPTYLFLMLFISIYFLHQTFHFPVSNNQEQSLVDTTVSWLKSENLLSNKIVSAYFPYLIYRLNQDPWSGENSIRFDVLKRHGYGAVPTGSIIIWDSHFAKNHENIPLELLQNNPKLGFVYKPSPSRKILTFNNTDFEIYIFEVI